MYNFVTTTLINSNVYGPKKETLIETITDGDVTELQIKRIRSFFKGKLGESVVSIYKAVGYDAKLSTATIDFSKVFSGSTVTEDEAGHYRLAINIRLQGSENPYYANDLVFKGKPFFVEFMAKEGQTLATVAEVVKKLADKYIAMVYEDKLLELTVSGSTLTITAVDEFQKFIGVAVQKFKAGIFAMEGAFENVQTLGKMEVIDPQTGEKASKVYYWTLDSEEVTSQDSSNAAISVVQGIEGFGTYHHLMKDYRLPTAANTRWIKILNDETPVIGKVYDQYTITYCSECGNMGTSVVGEPTKSVTTHVFWVQHGSDAQTALESGLTAIGWANGNSGDTNENGIIDTVPTAETKA